MFQGLSLKDRYYHETYDSSYHIVIPGSVIPKWFSHRSMGAEVNIKVETSSHLCDEWMGIAVCVVFSCLPHHHIDDYCYCAITSRLIVNGEGMNTTAGTIRMVGLSDHMWLFYLLPQYYVEEVIELLKECEENEFKQVGIRIEPRGPGMEVKKCGFRMVYKKDVEDLNQTVAQSSNTSHNFDNSVVGAEGNMTIMMGLDLVEKEALMNYNTHKGMKDSQNLWPMVTLIVRSIWNTMRSSVIGRNLVKVLGRLMEFRKSVQILCKSLDFFFIVDGI